MDRRDFLIGASVALLGAAAKTELLGPSAEPMCALKLRPSSWRLRPKR